MRVERDDDILARGELLRMISDNRPSLELIGGELENTVQKEADDLMVALWISLEEHPILSL